MHAPPHGSSIGPGPAARKGTGPKACSGQWPKGLFWPMAQRHWPKRICPKGWPKRICPKLSGPQDFSHGPFFWPKGSMLALLPKAPCSVFLFFFCSTQHTTLSRLRFCLRYLALQKFSTVFDATNGRDVPEVQAWQDLATFPMKSS